MPGYSLQKKRRKEKKRRGQCSRHRRLRRSHDNLYRLWKSKIIKTEIRDKNKKREGKEGKKEQEEQ